MKFKHLISLMLCAVMLLSLSVAAYADSTVILYSENGDTIEVNSWEVSSYEQVGWHQNRDDVTTTIYSSGKSAVVFNGQVADYLAAGWSLTPVKANTVSACPVVLNTSLYSSTPGTITLNSFYITNVQYAADTNRLRINYCADFQTTLYYNFVYIHCFDASGNKLTHEFLHLDENTIDIPINTAYFIISGNYENKGGQYIHCKQIDLYAPDGSVSVIYDLQAPLQSESSKCSVTLYSTDGRTIDVSPYEVDTYKNVGWFTAAEYVFLNTKTLANAYVAKKNYNEAVLAVEAKEGAFKGTAYEYDVAVFKRSILDSWSKAIGSPLAVIKANPTSYDEVAITFRNLSYKTIDYFELKFNLYDSAGRYISPYYSWYYLSRGNNIAPGEQTTIYWDTWRYNIKSVKNISIKFVTYTDGTRWGTPIK